MKFIRFPDRVPLLSDDLRPLGTGLSLLALAGCAALETAKHTPIALDVIRSHNFGSEGATSMFVQNAGHPMPIRELRNVRVIAQASGFLMR